MWSDWPALLQNWNKCWGTGSYPTFHTKSGSQDRLICICSGHSTSPGLERQPSTCAGLARPWRMFGNALDHEFPYKYCRGGPSAAAWPPGGRRKPRPSTFQRLTVSSTKMFSENLMSSRQERKPLSRFFLGQFLFPFLCVSVGTYWKVWKNRQSYKSL